MGCNFLSSKKIQAGEDSRYMKDSPIVLPVDACLNWKRVHVLAVGMPGQLHASISGRTFILLHDA
jgi:hypothetical protein